MYNGIGLTTPRGSGTNGYVQRNFALVRHRKEKVDYKTEDEILKMEASAVKKPNQEILDHERKRKIELKCLEMEELMGDQGYAEDDIESKVSAFRRALMEQSNKGIPKDEFGRPDVRETHQLAEANQQKNARLREAFGIDPFYIDGSSLDPDRKAKEAAAQAASECKYTLINESSERFHSHEPAKKKAKKAKKKKSSNRGRSESMDTLPKKKKSKKRKHELEENYLKTKPKKKMKSRNRSPTLSPLRKGKHNKFIHRRHGDSDSNSQNSSHRTSRLGESRSKYDYHEMEKTTRTPPRARNNDKGDRRIMDESRKIKQAKKGFMDDHQRSSHDRSVSLSPKYKGHGKLRGSVSGHLNSSSPASISPTLASDKNQSRHRGAPPPSSTAKLPRHSPADVHSDMGNRRSRSFDQAAIHDLAAIIPMTVVQPMARSQHGGSSRMKQAKTRDSSDSWSTARSHHGRAAPLPSSPDSSVISKKRFLSVEEDGIMVRGNSDEMKTSVASRMAPAETLEPELKIIEIKTKSKPNLLQTKAASSNSSNISNSSRSSRSSSFSSSSSSTSSISKSLASYSSSSNVTVVKKNGQPVAKPNAENVKEPRDNKQFPMLTIASKENPSVQICASPVRSSASLVPSTPPPQPSGHNRMLSRSPSVRTIPLPPSRPLKSFDTPLQLTVASKWEKEDTPPQQPRVITEMVSRRSSCLPRIPKKRAHSRRRASRSPKRRTRSRTVSRSMSRSHSHSKSRSGSRSSYRSRSRSSQLQVSGGSVHRSRSPSIPRRHGSPSFLDKRRITSARKRPIPYHRPSPPSSLSCWSASITSSSSRSRTRSRERYSSSSEKRSLPSTDDDSGILHERNSSRSRSSSRYSSSSSSSTTTYSRSHSGTWSRSYTQSRSRSTGQSSSHSRSHSSDSFYDYKTKLGYS